MQKFVIDLGGSIVMPKDFQSEFLQKLRTLLIEQAKDKKFYIVVGGGWPCREFNRRAEQVTKLSSESLDWLGIKVTHLNAFFLAPLLGEAASKTIFTDPTSLPEVKENIVVGGGWKPGNSTDYVAVKVAAKQEISTLVILTNVDYVYDKDPRKFDDAKPIEKMTWADLKAIVGDEWIPGANTPLDPLACKLAEEIGLKVVFMNGTNVENFAAFLNGNDFIGTTIA